ncbi:hypothetical protein [Leucobacter denitrificans]|uniref:Uncharacterized protein n=1 Tax=Leucobacter denitrificans TaxID=683042 RepID=A0A7G9S629_9MICO|nr:hypothetical protein [Leucobacter denitrificans]QNN63304.1 hypothetical protein H9L06_02910 [Leucobacter denitrificans]
MTVTATSIQLADQATRDDLRSFLARLVRVGEPEVRIRRRDDVLGVFGCTQAPAGILDTDPVVLVMRGFALAEQQQGEIDDVFEARAFLDRLARLEGSELSLPIPDMITTAAWAGVLPPNSGWQAYGMIDASSLAVVAKEGMSRVAESVPVDAGDPVVQRIRRSVWGSEIAPGIPASAAFAAESMGFLSGVDRLILSKSQHWTRLSGLNGYVILRFGAGFVR